MKDTGARNSNSHLRIGILGVAQALGALEDEAEMADSGRLKYESILLIHSFLPLEGIN